MNPEFISNIESLLDSRITTLEMTLFNDVSPTLLKGRHIKRISLCHVWFRFTSRQHIAEYRALGPWKHLETLDVHSAPFFELASQGDTPILKTLTVTLQDSDMANAISCHWRHWTALEDVTLNLDNDHIYAGFRVDYSNLSSLTRLSFKLRLEFYNSSRTKSSIESNTHQILDLLGPHLPPSPASPSASTAPSMPSIEIRIPAARTTSPPRLTARPSTRSWRGTRRPRLRRSRCGSGSGCQGAWGRRRWRLRCSGRTGWGCCAGRSRA
ncbi:hypothetical protein BJ912DRAFT_422154 [Pholiota molesta]|nr:hypothetical protein BJ912DRAFT_422154 [Pholiota molesta]